MPASSQLLKFAELKYQALRSVALQCGHSEEELLAGDLTADDAENLLKCFERESWDGERRTVENHYFTDALIREQPKDQWSRIQIEGLAFLATKKRK
jgi:hypothetical protein